MHAQFGSNLVFEIERGDRSKTEATMAAAAKIVELRLNYNRLSAIPIEPRAYLWDHVAARIATRSMRPRSNRIPAALALG